MQSAVSSNWKPLESGDAPLPVHFAQINRRDGFFLNAARIPMPPSAGRDLEGRTLLADHGLQPLVMLKYAVHYNGAEWSRIRVIDAGSPEEMEQAFRAGQGDYVHLQASAPHQVEKDGAGHVVASVGRAMPPVAFSSLCASAAFLENGSGAQCSWQLTAGRANGFAKRRADEVAAREAGFFPGVQRGRAGGRDRGLSGARLLGGRPRNPRGSLRAGAQCFRVRRRDPPPASLSPRLRAPCTHVNISSLNISVKGEYALHAMFDLATQTSGRTRQNCRYRRPPENPAEISGTDPRQPQAGRLRRVAARRRRRLPAGACRRTDHGGRSTPLHRRSAGPQGTQPQDRGFAVCRDVAARGSGRLGHHRPAPRSPTWREPGAEKHTKFVPNWEI